MSRKERKQPGFWLEGGGGGGKLWLERYTVCIRCVCLPYSNRGFNPKPSSSREIPVLPHLSVFPRIYACCWIFIFRFFLPSFLIFFFFIIFLPFLWTKTTSRLQVAAPPRSSSRRYPHLISPKFARFSMRFPQPCSGVIVHVPRETKP